MVRMLKLLCLLKMATTMLVVILTLHHEVEAEAIDLCPRSTINVTREFESTLPENQHVWAIGYYGRLYEISSNNTLKSTVTIKNRSRIIFKWEFSEHYVRIFIEPYTLAEAKRAPFELVIKPSSALVEMGTIARELKLTAEADGLQFLWKFADNECQFNITVKECSYAGGKHKPSAMNGSYLQKRKLHCSNSNSKLFHVKNGTIHENGANVTCLSDATWSNADEYECWTKPTVELEGSLTVKENETLSLKCSQNGGYPNVSTSLFFIAGRNVTGTTRVTYRDDEQKVYCLANSRYTKLSNEAAVKSEEKELNVKYAPRGNETQNCVLRNNKTCYIDFRSNPKAENCSWTKGKNAGSVNITTKVESKFDGSRNHQCKLAFIDVDAKLANLTEVKVEITSKEFPNHSLIVQLRLTPSPDSPDSNTSFPVLIIIIGGAGVVLIAIIVVGICCVLKKKNASTSTENSAHLPDPPYDYNNENQAEPAYAEIDQAEATYVEPNPVKPWMINQSMGTTGRMNHTVQQPRNKEAQRKHMRAVPTYENASLSTISAQRRNMGAVPTYENASSSTISAQVRTSHNNTLNSSVQQQPADGAYITLDNPRAIFTKTK